MMALLSSTSTDNKPRSHPVWLLLPPNPPATVLHACLFPVVPLVCQLEPNRVVSGTYSTLSIKFEHRRATFPNTASANTTELVFAAVTVGKKIAVNRRYLGMIPVARTKRSFPSPPSSAGARGSKFQVAQNRRTKVLVTYRPRRSRKKIGNSLLEG